MTNKFRGNALMEYVLPLGILLVGAGIITSMMVDLPKAMNVYFAKASGSAPGAQIVMEASSKGASGSLGTGAGNFTSFGGGSAGGGGGGVYYSPGGRSGSRADVMGGNGDELKAFRRISPAIAKAAGSVPPDASANYKGAVFGDASIADSKAAIISRGAGKAMIAMADAALIRARTEVTLNAATDTAGRVAGGDWAGVATVVSNTDSAIKNDSNAFGVSVNADNMRCTFKGCAESDFAAMAAGAVIENQMANSFAENCYGWECAYADQESETAEVISGVLGVSVMSGKSYKPWEKDETAWLEKNALAGANAAPLVTTVEETVNPDGTVTVTP